MEIFECLLGRLKEAPILQLTRCLDPRQSNLRKVMETSLVNMCMRRKIPVDN